MIRLLLALFLPVFTFTCIIWVGDLPARRYSQHECQKKIIYQQKLKDMDLLTLGGSRMSTATVSSDFDEAVSKSGIEGHLVYNMSHDSYSIGTEYVILRDVLSRHDLKTALVLVKPSQMIRPSSDKYNAPTKVFTKLAKLSDIPLHIWTTWPESPIAAISGARDIVLSHLRVVEIVRGLFKQKNGVISQISRNCDFGDLRLNVEMLAESRSVYFSAKKNDLDWDVKESGEYFLRWMQAYKSLEDISDTKIIFLLLSGTHEPLPAKGFDESFERITGIPIITLSPDIHQTLSMKGKRDWIHINQIGRKFFLPWLVGKIKEKCPNKKGCL